ncbi:MAG: hypothetical protein Q7T20_06030 [Saprospiraceae bacterium]|nr:hypothetical protein [Saprospiraceae bacterium]
MTPIRYTYLVLLLFLLAGTKAVRAQCSVDAVATSVTCFGFSNGSIDLTASNGTAPYTYAWSNGHTDEDLSGLAAGTYTCTVSDNAGCTTTTAALVTSPAALSIMLSDIILNCVVLSSSLSPSVSGGTPPYNYQWGNGFTTQNIQAQQPGTYFLTVTDVNGCTATKAPNVLEDVVPPIACIGPAQVLTCALTQVMLDGSCSSFGPNFDYIWSGPGINSGNFDAQSPIINLQGTYSLTVTNTINGCSAVVNTFVVQDIATPSVSVSAAMQLPCGGGELTLSGSGSIGPTFTYSWFTANGNILSGANTLTPVVNEPGTYTLMITNTATSCTSIASVEITGGSPGPCSTIEGRILQDT